MSFNFSTYPGAYERQFIRAQKHPQLFPKFDCSTQQLRLDQQQDQQEAENFQQDLIQLIQIVVDLDNQTDSQILLNIKAELEQAYTLACSLSQDQTQNKQAIARLIEVIIQTIEQHRDPNDQLALKELEMEKQAREIHFNMIENPTIADLLREEPPFEQQSLLAVLLSENESSCMQCLSLFDDDQIINLIEQGLELRQQLHSKQLWQDQYQNNLQIMGQIIEQSLPPENKN